MKFIALFITVAFFSTSFTNANPARLTDNVNIVVDLKSNRNNHSTPILNNNGTQRYNHSTPVSHGFNETHRYNHSTPILNNNGTHRFNHSTLVSHGFNETQHHFNIARSFHPNNVTSNNTWLNSPSIYTKRSYHHLNSSSFFNGTNSNVTEVDISALPTIYEVKSLLSDLRTIKSSLESKLNDLSAFTKNGTELHSGPHYHTEKEEIKVTETKRRTEKKGDSVITENFETKKHINREKSWDE